MKRIFITKKLVGLFVLSALVVSLYLYPFTGISANINPNPSSTFAGPPPIDVEYDV